MTHDMVQNESLLNFVEVAKTISILTEHVTVFIQFS